ncbi:MAG: hypothetical protein LBM70_09170 [Victivallales bacterium]|nr:hypothetical protein [Victivallales bacterium]
MALGILALSLAGLLQLLTASQNRIAKIHEKWQENHMLMQAAEYYLLQANEDPGDVPVTFFPYRDYAVNCFFRDAENLPEVYTDISEQLPLKTCVVELIRQRDQKNVGTILVDQISYEETAQNN